MEEYLFLFVLGLVWTIFAVVQDLRKREVANWLNFSLIAFALAYRAFYAVIEGNGMFFISGIFGFFVFFGLAHLFYYSKAFAGGDAKLMMGFGIILPYSNLIGMVKYGFVFIFALFFAGALYSLAYSFFIVIKKRQKFRLRFNKELRKTLRFLVIYLVFSFILLLFFDIFYWVIIFTMIIIFYFLFIYIKALEVCMINLVDARKLQEGDWLERDVRIFGKVIKKSVHGLNNKEIEILKKVGKSVLIKEGIPFTPAFLISLLIIMGLFFGVLSAEVFFFFGL